MASDSKELAKLATRLGYESSMGGKHIHWVHPVTGRRVVIHMGSKMNGTLATRIRRQLRLGAILAPPEKNGP